MARQSFTVGQEVEFVYQKTPKTRDGKILFARRPRNMAEAAKLQHAQSKYKDGWDFFWAIGPVEDISCHAYKVAGYWIPNEEVRARGQ